MAVAEIKATIIKEIEKIPEDHLQELQKLIHSFKLSLKKRNKNELQKLLLEGPVWGKTELENVQRLRKEMNAWPIQKF